MGFFNWGPMGNDSAVSVLTDFLKICGKTFVHDGLVSKLGFVTVDQTARNGQKNAFTRRHKIELYIELHHVLGTLVPSDVEPNYPALLEYASTKHHGFFLFEIIELTPMVNTSECVGNKYQVLAHLIMASGARCPKALMQALCASFTGDMTLRSGGYQGLKEQRLYAFKRWYKKNKKRGGGERWQFEEGWPHQTFIDDYHKPIGKFPPGMKQSVVKRDQIHDTIASGKGWIDKIVSKKPKFFANPNTDKPHARNSLTGPEMDEMMIGIKNMMGKEEAPNRFSSSLDFQAHLLASEGLLRKQADRTCANCSKKAINGKKLLTCSGCKSVWYCREAERNCQRTHWNFEHKKMCKMVHKMRAEMSVKGSIYNKKKKQANKSNNKKEDK